MENNTLLSNEMEEMRSQIDLLKKKLEQQTIVNERSIRRAMKYKMSDINRTMVLTSVFGVFALVYCTWFFYSQGCSLAFVITTAAILVISVALTVYQRLRLGSIDFSEGNLVEVAGRLGKVRRHYYEWPKIAIPVIVPWLAWCIYEIFYIFGTDTFAIGMCVGALIGGLVGGVIGLRINRKVIRRADEILHNLEDLQKEK